MAAGPEVHQARQTSAAEPTILLERYVLGEVIGRGGMATVYRANDTMLGRAVAIKLLHQSISRDLEFVEQFLEMERRIARLYHPNLVTIYDAGLADEGCYVVMEYVAAGSLRDLLQRRGPRPEADVIRLSAEVAGALELLHSERIIHGDIKPDNVLLDEQDSAKLVDFGIARIATTTRGISSESLGGSVPYLAPEQLERGQANPRSDVYALGLVAYELLTGEKAFDGENWVAVAAARLARDPTPMRALRPEISNEIERVVARAVRRDPAERWASAAEFQAALLAARPGPGGRAAREPGQQRAEREISETADGPLAPATPAASGPRRAPSTSHRDAPVDASRRRGEPPPDRGVRSATPRRSWQLLFQILRGEHPLALPLLVAVVVLDVLLLAIILGMFAFSGSPEAALGMITL